MVVVYQEKNIEENSFMLLTMYTIYGSAYNFHPIKMLPLPLFMSFREKNEMKLTSDRHCNGKRIKFMHSI